MRAKDEMIWCNSSVEAVKVVIHRIIEWSRLEETHKIIQFQPTCHEEGHLPLDQIIYHGL